MAGSGRLHADPLFQGLTRPAMIMGVSYEFEVVNLMFSWIGCINTKDFIVLLVMLPVMHGIAYLICMREPRMIRLLMLRGARGYKSWNNMLGYHFNTNSYDVF